jgi:hypothetical protein
MGNSASVLMSGEDNGKDKSDIVILSDSFFEIYKNNLSYVGYKEYLNNEQKQYKEYLLKMFQEKGVNTWCGV